MTEQLNVPKIFVINLKHRTDRLASINAELDRFGLLDKSEIVEGVIVHGPRYGNAGVALAHKKCVELAKERGYETVIVLEDDCKFLVPRDQFISELNEFIKAEEESAWSGLWFGSFYTAYHGSAKYAKPISYMHDTGTLLHKRSYDAYIKFCDHCANKYIETGEERYNLDAFLHQLNLNDEAESSFAPFFDSIYITREKLCGQADVYSDRVGEVIAGGHGLYL